MLNKDFRARLATRIKNATDTDQGRSVPLLYRDRSADARHGLPVAGGRCTGRPGQEEDRHPGQRWRGPAEYRNWVQKIRTPALKGLGLNRFVTDSYRNTKTWPRRRLHAGCRLRLPAARRTRLRCDRGGVPARRAGGPQPGAHPQAESAAGRGYWLSARVPVFAVTRGCRGAGTAKPQHRQHGDVAASGGPTTSAAAAATAGDRCDLITRRSQFKSCPATNQHQRLTGM